MALQAVVSFRGLESQQGYWRIGDFHWNVSEPATVRVVVYGYANQQAYLDGNESVRQEFIAIEIPLDDPSHPKTQLLHNIGSILYPLIKEQAEQFKDAIDV